MCSICSAYGQQYEKKIAKKNKETKQNSYSHIYHHFLSQIRNNDHMKATATSLNSQIGPTRSATVSITSSSTM